MRQFEKWLALAACVMVAVPSGAAEITTNDLASLPEADVIVFGEVHDNPVHHLNQAAAVGAMGAKAVVFEMLSEGQALDIRPEMLADAAELAQALGWDSSGWPDFAIYYPIFEKLDGVAIFGGAAPFEDVRKAVSDGSAAVMGTSAAIFGLGDALDDAEQSLREAGQMAAHCDALPVSILGGMVEAQRLRDAYMARAIIAANAETGGPTLVITGNGHARRDWGVPRILDIAAPDLVVLSIGQLEGSADRDAPFDHWFVTQSVEREDPCGVFEKQ